jgi:hypothetical protein
MSEVDPIASQTSGTRHHPVAGVPQNQNLIQVALTAPRRAHYTAVRTAHRRRPSAPA